MLYKIGMLTCFFILNIFSSIGQQLDIPNSSSKNSSNISVSPNFNPSPPEDNFIGLNDSEREFKNPVDQVLKSIAEKEQQMNLNDKGIIDPRISHENRLKQEIAELNGEYAKIDKYLGGFSSSSKSVTIVCRDFQFPDGDAVTIYLNDIPAIKNIVLTRSFVRYTLPLKKGLNVISFKALNQGSSGPNTASFMVIDENGGTISSNEWNLATDAKATLSIARVE